MFIVFCTVLRELCHYIKYMCDSLFTFTDPDSDSDQDSNPIPVVSS